MHVVPDDPAADWTAAGVYEVGPGLYRIPLPLPEDGLRAVNVYAVRDGDGLVLVDSGWALDESHDLLEEAVKALDLSLADVRRFLVTHVHRDHYTLAVAVRRRFGTRVSLGRGEARSLAVARDPAANPWVGLLTQLARAGAAELAARIGAVVASQHVRSDWDDPDDWLDAPAEITLEDGSWQAHPTPGHTRGHLVFVDPRRDVMFAGDHVLPAITPSIGFEQVPDERPLRSYLDSLRLVRALPDRRLLPAHGPVSPSVHARVDELLEHHDVRFQRIRETVEAGAGTPEEAARRMLWTRRDRRFDELDLMSRCLAVTETMAHLDVLADAGSLRRAVVDGVVHYTA